MTDESILDPAAMDRLRDFAGDDEAFVAELVSTYLEDGASLVERMRAAAASGDHLGLSIASHSLKSNSANVGAMRLSELCRALEADARAGPVSDAVDRVADAEAAFMAARRELLTLQPHP